MRPALLLLIALVPLSGGCSFLIARRGEDLRDLTTRQEVRQRLGEPVASGVNNGRPYEDFHFTGKLADSNRAYVEAVAGAFTLGISEVAMLPVEAFQPGNDVLNGHDVRFVYDEQDNVTKRFVDGKKRDSISKMLESDPDSPR